MPHCAKVRVPIFTSLPDLTADEMLVGAIMILIAATVVLVALPAWLLQHLRTLQNQNLLVKTN